MFAVVAHAALAVLLYLLPVALAAGLRWRPAQPLSRALVVPVALGLDAMLTVTLCAVMPLGRAAALTRALYAVAMVLATARGATRWRPSWAFVGGLVASAALVGRTYQRISYELILWDRVWHIPLVSSLRVARLPFENAYAPKAPLRYHWLGDVVPAMLQSLSGDRIHSALALTLAHDLYLALSAAMTLWAVGFAAGRRWWIWPLAPLLGLAATLGGPFVLFNVRPDELTTVVDSGRLCGTTFLTYATLGYRPHAMMAGFYLTSIFVAMIARTRRDADRSPHATATMLVSAVAMSLLDEASLALVPCALLAAWCVAPRALHRRWYLGPAVALMMLAALPAVSRLYGGSLAPGGPARSWRVVPARHLELFSPPVPMTDWAEFREIFARDYLPCYGVALLLLALAVWTRRRDLLAAAVFYGALCVGSWALAFRVEVNDAATEGHRFITAMMVLSPVVGAYAMVATRRGLALRALMALVVAGTAASTLLWRDAFYRHRLDGPELGVERTWIGARSPYPVDCDAMTGRELGRRVVPSYIEANAPMLYAGCAPVRLIGPTSDWGVSIGPVLHGPRAADAYEWNASDPPEEVVCNPRGDHDERVCEWAAQALSCRAVGREGWRRCALPAGRRAEFLEQLRQW